MLENITETSLLFDFYGELLPKKQRDIFRLYHEDNYSLSEIAEEYEMTRQGVYEAVKRAECRLHRYEEKLGLVKKFAETEKALYILDKELKHLIQEYTDDIQLKIKLKKVKSIIRELTV